MAFLILVSSLPFIHGEYQDTCPEGVTGCTEDNKCLRCNVDNDRWYLQGCEYCNIPDDDWRDRTWCPWRCVQCEEGYELIIKEYPGYESDIFCNYTDATTTSAEECTAEWSWSRSYSNIAEQYWWIDDPTFTFSGVKKCPDGFTKIESDFSLVFSSVDIDVSGGSWECQDDSCDIESSFGGVSAYKNRYATSTDTGTIALDVVQFTEDARANIQGNNVEVRANSLKFGINMTDVFVPVKVCIDGWAFTWKYDKDSYTLCDEEEGYQRTYYNQDTDVIVVDDGSCLSEEVANDKTIQVSISDDAKSVTLGDYQIYNDETAKCNEYDDIEVTVTAKSKQIFLVDYRGGGSQAFATVEMCYSFAECASGNIEYDPFVYYEGDDADSGFEVVSINCCMLTMIAATFIMVCHV